MQYQIPLPRVPVQGPTVQQSAPIPPVASQIQMAWYSALDQARAYNRPLSGQVNQGALVQQTNPVPAVACIEMSRYSALDQVRLIPGPIQYVSQGASVQATTPIPGVARIEMSQWTALDRVRTIPGAIPQVNQGATVQATVPIPAVSGMEMSQWMLLERVRLIPGPRPQIPQAVVSSATIPNPSPAVFKELSWWSGLERARLIPGAIQRVNEGATVQQLIPPARTFGEPLSMLYPGRQYPQPQTPQTTAVVVQVLSPLATSPAIAWWLSPRDISVVKRTDGASVQALIPPAMAFAPPGSAWRPLPQVPPLVNRAEGLILQPQSFPSPFPAPYLPAFPGRYYPGVLPFIQPPFAPPPFIVPPPAPGIFRTLVTPTESEFGDVIEVEAQATIFRTGPTTGTPVVFRPAPEQPQEDEWDGPQKPPTPGFRKPS